jgi:TPR repeat protein
MRGLAAALWVVCSGVAAASGTETVVGADTGAASHAAVTGDAAAFAAAVAAYRAGEPGAAFAQFLILARQDMPQAQFNLALLFRAGEGVPQNRREALYWAWRARIGGLPQAGLLVAELLASVDPEQRGLLADRLLADLAPARQAANGRLIAASALVESELRAEPDRMQVYVWYSIAAALSAPGAAKARDASFAALLPEDQAGAEDAALQGFQEWCAALAAPVQACIAVQKSP